MKFKNREEAGRLLGEKLYSILKNKQCVVYGLPRGGVEVAAMVAKKLDCPFNISTPRKIGHPDHPEYAIAAVTADGFLLENSDEVKHIDKDWYRNAILKEQRESQRRKDIYTKGLLDVPIKNKTIVIVDDGIATGLTMLASIKEIQAKKPKRVIVAVPIIPESSAKIIGSKVDKLVSLVTVQDQMFVSIGSYFEEFPQVTDKEVITLLKKFHLAYKVFPSDFGH